MGTTIRIIWCNTMYLIICLFSMQVVLANMLDPMIIQTQNLEMMDILAQDANSRDPSVWLAGDSVTNEQLIASASISSRSVINGAEFWRSTDSCTDCDLHHSYLVYGLMSTHDVYQYPRSSANYSSIGVVNKAVGSVDRLIPSKASLINNLSVLGNYTNCDAVAAAHYSSGYDCTVHYKMLPKRGIAVVFNSGYLLQTPIGEEAYFAEFDVNYVF